MAFGYYGTILTVTRVFEEDGVGNDGNLEFNYTSIFISSAAEFVGLTFVIMTVESVGRIWPMSLNFLLGGTFVLILALSAANGNVSGTFLTANAFFARSVEMGASCLLWVTTAEVLSTEIRSTGNQRLISHLAVIFKGNLLLLYVHYKQVIVQQMLLLE